MSNVIECLLCHTNLWKYNPELSRPFQLNIFSWHAVSVHIVFNELSFFTTRLCFLFLSLVDKEWVLKFKCTYLVLPMFHKHACILDNREPWTAELSYSALYTLTWGAHTLFNNYSISSGDKINLVLIMNMQSQNIYLEWFWLYQWETAVANLDSISGVWRQTYHSDGFITDHQ